MESGMHGPGAYVSHVNHAMFDASVSEGHCLGVLLHLLEGLTSLA